MASDRMKRALQEVVEELKAMPPDEFNKMLEEHKGGDIARLLHYGWHPECPHDPYCDECVEDLLYEASRKLGR